MTRATAAALALLGCLLVVGCLGGSLPGTGGPSVEERPLPERPGSLTNDSVLEYAVSYEAETLNNRIVREHDPSAIASIETCEYPAENPQDGALDYWIERRVGDEFYLVLRCPVDIDERGAEQSGSGTVGKWTTYAVTPETTRRVELGNDIVRVTNRTVNFDDEPHELAITVRPADGANATAIVERADLGATSYARIRAVPPRAGTYELQVSVDGIPSTTVEVAAAGRGNLLRRVGIYVSPAGDVVVDRRTETYLDG